MVIRGIVKRKQTLTKSTGTKKKTSAKKSKGTIKGTKRPLGVMPGYSKKKTAPKVSRKRKADGTRCKMQTSNKSQYCYYHD